MRSTWLLTGLAGVLAVAASVGACSASNGGSGSGFGGGGSSGKSSGPGALSGQNTGGSTGAIGLSTGSGMGTGAGNCDSGPDEDKDGDGWTVAQGDCNDCDPNVNPGAIDVVQPASADGGMPMQVDSNCNGSFDPPTSCDSGLALDDTNPMSAAKAIGLCQQASPDSVMKGQAGWAWGVVNVTYARASGAAYSTPGLQTGIMPTFGTNVNAQEGDNMLVMSSGHARTPGQTGACGQDSCASHMGAGKPSGFPSAVPGCGGGPLTPINDDLALLVQLRAPTNATGYSFKFKFTSFEFPEYVCSTYNDEFIALVNPAPMGSQNGNISFDSNNNPVSVNIGFFDVCDATSTNHQWTAAAGCGNHCPPLPSPLCPSGSTDLVGTGFNHVWSGNWGGSTSWLESQAPVSGGEEFSIQFTIWDAGDQALDSTVLVDAFQWVATPGTTVGTGKVPNPK